METPVELDFQGMDAKPAIRDSIDKQIAHQREANRMRSVGRADHRNRARVEHAGEIADGHAGLSDQEGAHHGFACAFTFPCMRSI